MKFFAAPDEQKAKYLSVLCFRISRPEPINVSNLTSYQFGWHVHATDPTMGALFSFDSEETIYVHPVSEIIARSQGQSLSSEDETYLRDLYEEDFAERFGSYQKEDGSHPYQSIEDLLTAIVGFWSEFQQIYTDDTQRESVRQALIDSDRVAIEQLVPSWCPEKDEATIFNEEWYQVNFNQLSREQLERDRFPGIGPSLADAIVSERNKNGIYADSHDVANRVSGVGETIRTMLADARDRGALVFAD